jgi:hypothetical protein
MRRARNVILYGQEKDAATSTLARMNMILHNNPTALIVRGNTLANPKFKDGDSLKIFDYVVANPPFSDKRWSTGLDQDSPVPIDNAVILQCVWPGFRIGIPPGRRPQDWAGKTFAAYCRYMTAVLEWADMKRWTATQLEATIFAENS